MQSQVLNVVPITSILGRLGLVAVGETGTIPFSMRKETKDFPGASCEEGCWCWQSMVVYQQLGPEVGNQPINAENQLQ